ncbi:hypothetical protein LEP1GSC082_1166 [Leptospira kirschneri str. H2]|nr:hypothetical protein LEP1GSC082_1166 [Leptospira kirschneri str. H2]
MPYGYTVQAISAVNFLTHSGSYKSNGFLSIFQKKVQSQA